jgi:hypothetical protein
VGGGGDRQNKFKLSVNLENMAPLVKRIKNAKVSYVLLLDGWKPCKMVMGEMDQVMTMSEVAEILHHRVNTEGYWLPFIFS